MLSLGLGLGLPLGGRAGVSIPALLPSAAWDGTADSGFDIDNPAPTDPTRTTAKPAFRLATVPGQRITGSHTVAAMALANNEGTLIGGIDRVRFHFEGSALDVIEPMLRTFTRRDGSTYRAPVYAVRLPKPSGLTGLANLYIEANPADATMQSRVIGPFSYSFGASLYDHTFEAANSAELTEAINDLKALTPDAARVILTASGDYIYSENATNYTFPSWLAIEPASGVEATFMHTETDRMLVRSGNVAFRNLTFDMRRISNLDSANGTPLWADHCLFTNSDPEGTYAKWYGSVRPIGRIMEPPSYFTECEFEYLNDPFSGPELARGNIARNGYADVSGEARCMFGNIVRDWDSSVWQNGEEAFTATYDGVEATATLSAPNSQGSTRVLTATWGSNTATLTLGNTEDDRLGITGNAYWPSQVVDWINGEGDYAGVGLADQDAGWSATLLDDTLLAFNINSGEGAGGPASDFLIDVKDQVRTVIVNFDIHPDGYQQRFGGIAENVIIYGEQWEVSGQLLFLSSDADTLDYAVVNNVFDFMDPTKSYLSQLGRDGFSHLMIAHNTWIDQRLNIETDGSVTLDAYSLIANNVLPSINAVSTSIVPAGVIAANHFYEGALPLINSVNTSVGGDADTLFADVAGYDYTPDGALLLNGKAPVFGFDARGRTRKDVDVMGALGSGAAEVTAYVPPPPNTEWDFTDFTTTTTGAGQAEIVSASVGRAYASNSSNRAGLAIALEAGTYRLRGTNAVWGSNGTAQIRLKEGNSLISNVDVTTVSGNVLFGAVAIDETFTLAAATNLILIAPTSNRSFQLTKGADPLLVKVS